MVGTIAQLRYIGALHIVSNRNVHVCTIVVQCNCTDDAFVLYEKKNNPLGLVFYKPLLNTDRSWLSTILFETENVLPLVQTISTAVGLFHTSARV